MATAGTRWPSRARRSPRPWCGDATSSIPLAWFCGGQRDNRKGVSDAFDIIGFNYDLKSPRRLFTRRHPKRPIYGSETASTISHARRVHDRPAAQYGERLRREHSAGRNRPKEWWKFYATREWEAGGFAWTGFDYRGEPTPYGWPSINSQFGIVDMCGFPKDIFFYYKAWWGTEPSLHLFPHWNFEGREGEEIPVWVHSNLDEVELFVNGKSLGSQKVPHLGHVEWKVKYEPGAIEARGSKGGKVVLTEKRETTGPAVAIRLTADRTEIDADGEDVAILKVEALDKEGRPVPTRRQPHRLQGLRRRRAHRRRQRRSQLPGERQGAEALALQRPGAGYRAVDQAAWRDSHRGGQGRLGWSGTDPGQVRHHDEASGVAAGGARRSGRKVEARCRRPILGAATLSRQGWECTNFNLPSTAATHPPRHIRTECRSPPRMRPR